MMRGASYRTGVAALAIVALPLAVPLALRAQVAEGEGGARLEAGLDLRLVVDDGTPEFRSGFDLDLISATRTQRLSFSGDFGLTVPLDDVETADVSDPRYGVNYLRDNGRSRIELGAFLQRQALDRVRLLDDDPETIFDESDLILNDDGTLEQRELTAAVELGLNDPVGGNLGYSVNDRIYTDTTDPDLLDTRTQTVTAGLRWDLDRSLRLTLDGEWRLTEEGDITATGEDRERTSIGVGVTWQMRPELSLDASARRVRIDTETAVLGVTATTLQDGVDLDLGLSLDRPNGGYRFSASRTVTAAGDVLAADLTRSLTLPGGAEIAATVGLTDLPSGNIYGTAALDYSRNTRAGALSFSLSRDAVVNSEDEDVLRTIARAGYSGDLPQGARWSLSGQVTNSVFVLNTEPDIASARLSLSYVRPLTEDWDLSTGVTWRATREEGVADARENTVFVSLERRFTFRR